MKLICEQCSRLMVQEQSGTVILIMRKHEMLSHSWVGTPKFGGPCKAILAESEITGKVYCGVSHHTHQEQVPYQLFMADRYVCEHGWASDAPETVVHLMNQIPFYEEHQPGFLEALVSHPPDVEVRE